MSWHYAPPLRDMRFVIDEVLDAPSQWAALPGLEELDRDTALQVIEQATRFAAEVLAPTNRAGDLEGCTLQPDGSVRTPTGFRAAYRAFVEAGWPALACDPAWGGQGLPQLLNAVLYEALVSSNHAWTMYPALLHGAYDTIEAHGSAALKSLYLPKLASGEWLSTMCLTEPHAGSDLGLVRTRAEPQPDGTHRISGAKIFISGADHDLTDNIVHLVLARSPGLGAGTKGLSLFVAPKWLPDGSRNPIVVTGLEHKMGIHGSATCQVSFEGATGWLVGEPGRGLAAMFVMMNSARLHVALQGLSHAELAHQNALRYALERLQLRAPTRPPGAAAGAADPIAWHAPMRRALLRQRVIAEGGRILAYESAMLLDQAQRDPDPARRARAHDRVSLLTPVLKAFLTDQGFAVASSALQVFGGHGYLHDWGIEQCLRDSRIALIYEGTNEIQAIDLLARKVLPDGGAKFAALLDALAAALPPGARHGDAVRDAIERLGRATRRLVERSEGDAELPLRVAGDFLHATGLVLLAQAWARADAVSSGDDAFHRAKRDGAAHCMAFVLPELDLRLDLLRAGEAALPFVDEQHLR